MDKNNKGRRLLLVAGVATAIRLLSQQTEWVEQYYSTGIYPYISAALKYLFGWIPFSTGDVIYTALIIWAVVKIIKGLRRLFRKDYNRLYLEEKAYRSLSILLLIYIFFNLLWGFNYNRKGINYQLGIKKEKYTTADLLMMDSLLVKKVNESKEVLLRQNKNYPGKDETVQAVAVSYSKLSKQYPWLTPYPTSAKTSLFGWAGNYLGFIGYYNPFTGEAQLNTTVPKFLQPYTACHEIAHQLGYAKENEANFVGYLAAASSSDTLFHYSAYLDLFLYTQRNLFAVDSAKAKYFSLQLIPAVKDDLQELKKFNREHQSPLEPVFRWIYERYLERNEQPSGLLTYDEVTGFIIAYYKKFGKI